MEERRSREIRWRVAVVRGTDIFFFVVLVFGGGGKEVRLIGFKY